ncbi:MAG: hypothetical protein J3Q66DRAFT_333802 [Benniella sp.]|nr:MAG: hypothetical protein J3Q66DRAFT_333802 [Benniella sp.]
MTCYPLVFFTCCLSCGKLQLVNLKPVVSHQKKVRPSIEDKLSGSRLCLIEADHLSSHLPLKVVLASSTAVYSSDQRLTGATWLTALMQRRFTST